MKRAVLILIIIAALAVPTLSRPYYNGLKVIVTPQQISQGKSFLVQVFALKDMKSISGSIFDKDIIFFKQKDHFRGIIGVPVNAAPGNYKLRLNMKYEDGAERVHDKYVRVGKGKFDKVSYWLKPQKKKLLAPDLINDEWAVIQKELIKETPKKLWKGSFRIPAVGTTSMRYGAWQVINGVARGQHMGWDIAGAEYYRVRAANNGQVVIAEDFKVFGRTVVINHGQGIYSLYFHLSRIDVKEKEVVWKGKIIGMMGSSGVATGTHLHWGLSVHDVRVDPMQWVYGMVAR